MEQEEEELQRFPEIVERMGLLEFLGLMRKKFGAQRTTQLIGWVILVGALGLENTPKLRKALREAGYSQSGFYRAMADLRAFGEHVEEVYGAKMSVEQVVRKISSQV